MFVIYGNNQVIFQLNAF